MNSNTAFGVYVGMCENCRKVLYENSKRYWIKFNGNIYCFCEHCVEVIEPKEEALDA